GARRVPRRLRRPRLLPARRRRRRRPPGPGRAAVAPVPAPPAVARAGAPRPVGRPADGLRRRGQVPRARPRRETVGPTGRTGTTSQSPEPSISYRAPRVLPSLVG